ncbi:MAG: efflux RND transporter permease subunit, partial [Spirochaetia bacterium]|nr:efflux RND transporter permease subunit [Spirochaetia bacterium]
MSVSRLVVNRPVLFTIIFVVLTGLGLFFYSDLPVEMMPEIEYPMITVITTYSGAAPESVEKSITKPIEEALTSVTGVKELTSQSSEGRSRVMLEFDFGTNLDTATNDIRDKLDRVKRSLPDDADTPLIRIFNSASMPIMRLAVRGDRDLGELRYIAENRIEDRLSQVEGVGDVNTYGGQVQAVQVELEQNRLDAYGITIASVKSALSKQNMELGGGDIEGSTREYLVRTTGEFKNVQEIAETVVAVKGGNPVHLYDLGQVFMGHKDKTSIASVNGVPGVYVSIQRATGANVVQVADGLYKKIEELKDYLPEDISLIIIRDDSTEIRDTLSELRTTMLQGLGLVICVLFVFLRSIRSTIIISISLPVAVLITVFAMYLCGFTLNMMSMTGLILGLGMILDASIVVLENVYQHLDKGETGKEAVIEGAHEMIASITASTMTTVVVFLPFIFYKNQLEMVGQILTDVIFTIIIAVSISLFVAIFLVPVLA